MADYVTVYQTNFGTVKMGPMFSSKLEESMLRSKRCRGKNQLLAKMEVKRIGSCIDTLAAIYWENGKHLREVP